MLAILRPVHERFKNMRWRVARVHVRADISVAIDQLEILEQEVLNMVSTDVSWAAKNELVRLFYAETEEARKNYQAGRYRAAIRCRKSAHAARICIERNMRAQIDFPGTRAVIN